MSFPVWAAACSILALACAAGTARAQQSVPAAADGYRVVAGDEWKPVEMTGAYPVPGSALDMSGLVEKAPAGTYGRVIRTPDGHLAFERRPDRRAIFFGCPMLPELSFTKTRLTTKAEIETYAEHIRLQGYNLVRPHFLDHALTRDIAEDGEFNADVLDRFDYFVKCLKDRGIYLYLDAMTSWKGYTKARSWTPEANAVALKTRMYTDPTARAHWEAGVRKLLTHVNPYTKTRLVDDPVVAVLLFFNEQEINAWVKIPESLEQPWREYLRKKYGTIDALKAAWVGENGKPLTEAASFEAIPLFTSLSLWEKNARGVDAESFLTATETELLEWYIARVREMGYTGLVSQYDYLQGLRYVVPRSRIDVVSMHGYHAHPSDYTNRGSKIPQTSALGSEVNWIRAMAATRFGDRPFLLTEYGHVYWNRYRYEEGLSMGAYSALQDFDGILGFAEPVAVGPGIIKPFTIHADPVARASQVVSGFLFARRDVRPASHYVNLEVRPEELYTAAAIHGGAGSDQSKLALVTGFGLSYTGTRPPAGSAPRRADVTLRAGAGARVTATSNFATLEDTPDGKFSAAEFVKGLKAGGLLPASNRTDPAGGIYESDTGQILLDAKNRRMTVRTPRLEGIAFDSLEGPQALGALTVASSTVPASVTAVALDDKDLKESRRILLVYATDALNGDSEYDSADRTVLRSIGTLPVLLRTGMLRVRLAVRDAGRLKCWALGMDGSRKQAIESAATADGLELLIDTRALTAGPTPFFEIARQ